ARDHVGPLRGCPAAEPLREQRRGGPHVVHGGDARRPGQPGERGADRLGDGFVQLVGDDPADVIRHEDLRILAHAGPLPPVSTRGRAMAAEARRAPREHVTRAYRKARPPPLPHPPPPPPPSAPTTPPR